MLPYIYTHAYIPPPASEWTDGVVFRSSNVGADIIVTV